MSSPGFEWEDRPTKSSELSMKYDVVINLVIDILPTLMLYSPGIMGEFLQY